MKVIINRGDLLTPLQAINNVVERRQTLPILGNVLVNADETGKAPKGKHTPKMRMWGARYGKEWVINPDVVLGLYAEAEDRALKQLHIYMLKIRDTDEDAMQEYLTIRWDLTSQSFESLGDPKATKPEEKIEVKFE